MLNKLYRRILLVIKFEMMFNCEKKLKMNSILSNVFLKKENTCIKQVNDKIYFFSK